MALSPNKNMTISLQTDNTLYLPIQAIATRLNELCASTRFVTGDQSVRFSESSIKCPRSHTKLIGRNPIPTNIDAWIVFTSVPYENNYFYEEHEKLVIVSVNSWNLLTDQPLVNGVIYFLCTLLAESLGFAQEHFPNRGCVNDMLVDKTGIDVGMRAASLCLGCKAELRARSVDATDLLRLLAEVAVASRHGITILDVSASRSGLAKIDLFLCHNSAEQDEVRALNERFKESGLVTWLDEDDLTPGSDWQSEIQRVIPRVRAAAVCVGGNGMGPWQRMETKGLLSEFVERSCRVVPVILSSAQIVPELPLFLRQFTWLDLRNNPERGIDRLVRVLREQDLL